MRALWTFAALASMFTTAHADLLDETFLHPLDGFTAYTLRAGEVLYAQPAAPVPGWAQIGVTDELTVEVDLTALVGGFFQAPYAPVPSENIRYRLTDHVAVEVMGQYLWRTFRQEDLDHLLVERKGFGGFAHVNASFPLGGGVTLHGSAGVSFQHEFRIANKDMRDVTFHDHFDPDGSLAIDWRIARWLALAASASYGSTFVYSDVQPRKWQFTYGPRFAPFIGLRPGILRDLRIELTAIAIYRPDIQELAAVYIPFFPYVYWQWRL